MSANDEPGDDGSRPAPWLPAVIVILTIAAVLGVWAFQPPQPLSPQSNSCPPSGTATELSSGPPMFTDNNIAIFVGGDYRSTSSHDQSEGLLVVMGDAEFSAAKSGNTQLGSVTLGTQTAPTGGTDMLVVGGDLIVARSNSLEVGAGVPAGGHVMAGGTISGRSSIESHGGEIKQGVGSTASEQYAGFLTTLISQSEGFDSQLATGSALVTENSLFVTGDGSSSLQVVDVDSTALGAVQDVDFKDIPEGASLVVNVSGPDVTFGPAGFTEKGIRVDDPFSPATADVAARILWNFTNARSVTLDGSSPMLGSVLVPHGDVDLATNTNGRLYLSGDLSRSDGAQAQHNLPWLGSSVFGCKASRAALGAPAEGTLVSFGPTAWPKAIASTLILLAGAGLVIWFIRLRHRLPLTRTGRRQDRL